VTNKIERDVTRTSWKEIVFVREIRNVKIPEGLSTEG
jgi:hypothetical protein